MNTKILKKNKNIILASMLIPIYAFNMVVEEGCIFGSNDDDTQITNTNSQSINIDLLKNMENNLNDSNNQRDSINTDTIKEEIKELLNKLPEDNILKETKDQNAVYLFNKIVLNMQKYNELQNKKNEITKNKKKSKSNKDNATIEEDGKIQEENKTVEDIERGINSIAENLNSIQEAIISNLNNNIRNGFKEIKIEDLTKLITDNLNNENPENDNETILNKSYKLLMLLLIQCQLQEEKASMDTLSKNITYSSLKKVLNGILKILKLQELQKKNTIVKPFVLSIKNALYRHLIITVYNHAELCCTILGDFFLVKTAEKDENTNSNIAIENFMDTILKRSTGSDSNDSLAYLFKKNQTYKNICDMTISQIEAEKNILIDFKNKIPSIVLVKYKEKKSYYLINFEQIQAEKQSVINLLQYCKNSNNNNDMIKIKKHLDDINNVFNAKLNILHIDKNTNITQTNYTISEYVNNTEENVYKELEDNKKSILIFNNNKTQKINLEVPQVKEEIIIQNTEDDNNSIMGD